jgi:predicted flap endonuclease-1-like 5' DNA nuclease
MSEEQNNFPYAASLGVIAFLASVLWFILDTIFLRARPAAQRARRPVDIVLPDTPVEPGPAAGDDLTAIEGIGAKVSAVLAEAGIHSFEQLASSSVQFLKDTLVQAGNRLSNPGTWPEQAALAAKGAWEQLKTLQSELKGGRRTP